MHPEIPTGIHNQPLWHAPPTPSSAVSLSLPHSHPPRTMLPQGTNNQVWYTGSTNQQTYTAFDGSPPPAPLHVAQLVWLGFVQSAAGCRLNAASAAVLQATQSQSHDSTKAVVELPSDTQLKAPQGTVIPLSYVIAVIVALANVIIFGRMWRQAHEVQQSRQRR